MYKNVSLKDLQLWTGGVFSKETVGSSTVSSISTDSRSIKRGEVFAALKGENFDGHAYIEKAVEQGASMILCEKALDLPCPVLVVKDTLQALVKIGRALRQKFTGPVFSVTGSAGKSSTRDMIAELLGPHTLKAPASFNNLLGVSKTLFLLEESHKKLVLEMGMNGLGEIREMCEAFEPNLVLITNIGDAHIGKLGSREAIYRAKKEMFDFAAKNKAALGVALNVDDPMVERAYQEAELSKLKTLSYSAEGKPANVRILYKAMDPNTCALNLKVEIQGTLKEIHCHIFGLHHAQNIAAAIAAVRLIDTPIEDIVSRLSGIRPAPHRGNILSLNNGVTCIDESYNSNPSALKSSLASLANVNAQRSRLIVIGEMRELEGFSKDLHEECGRFLLKSHAGLPFRLLTVGEGAKPLGDIVKRTFGDVFHVATHEEALAFVKKELRQNDVLFVKGSHGVRLDLLVDALATEKK